MIKKQTTNRNKAGGPCPLHLGVTSFVFFGTLSSYPDFHELDTFQDARIGYLVKQISVPVLLIVSHDYIQISIAVIPSSANYVLKDLNHCL